MLAKDAQLITRIVMPIRPTVVQWVVYSVLP